MFAIAMLFIGPPIGQWRAAQQAHSAHESGAVSSGPVEPAVNFAHAHAQGHGSATAAPVSVQGGHAKQVGVLVLDHCGYCHLVACFAALPGSWAGLPLFDWGSAQPVLYSYQAPSAPFISSQQARAPPLFHV